jgi:hypothetical protein
MPADIHARNRSMATGASNPKEKEPKAALDTRPAAPA